jgi:Xaa-Pro dipeptidase
LTYHISSDELTLFIPPIDPESVIWSGLPLSPAEAQEIYQVDRVLLTTEVNPTLAHLASLSDGKPVVFAISEQVSEETSFRPFADADFSSLKKAIEETRVVKDEYEIALIRKANDISARAHTAVLKAAKSATNERELVAAFIGTCIASGGPDQAYPPIVASGTSGATLHYTNNNESLIDTRTKKRKLNLLIDAAAEYRAYAADVTRTFPLSGRFSPESRAIYDIVLQMQSKSFEILKEGVLWEDVHVLAHRIAIKGLLKLGILRGVEEELFEKRISVAFFPHGLGHYLGMDTHDTGGNARYEDKDTMFRYLRVRGRLPAGSVITVEPGVCFPLIPTPSLYLLRIVISLPGECCCFLS